VRDRVGELGERRRISPPVIKEQQYANEIKAVTNRGVDDVRQGTEGRYRFGVIGETMLEESRKEQTKNNRQDATAQSESY